MILLIVGAAGGEQGLAFLLTLLIVILGGTALFYTLFPGSFFFSISLANCLAAYTCIFIFLVETNFANASRWAVQVGFALPVIAFLSGALLRRNQVREIIFSQRLRRGTTTVRGLIWFLPMLAITAMSFALPGLGMGENETDLALLAMMSVVAAVVLVLSPAVSGFLLDTGLVFEQFFERIGRVLIPAFAFLTFYVLIVILFACLYRIIDLYVPGAHFNFNGVPHEISFSESLYFSLVSMSTLGYGDVAPTGGLVRALVVIEVVVGVLLMLFGFAEIMRYSQEKAAGDERSDDQA
jgi:voltage-gated potassium channel